MLTVFYFLLGFAAIYAVGGILLLIEFRQAIKDKDGDENS